MSSPYQSYDDDVSADLTGQFLKKADFDDRSAIVFTIMRVDKRTFEARNGRPAQDKWVVTFDGDRCLSLNKTNLQLLAKWFGKRARAWQGKKVTVYWDESVSFGGQLVGGMRLRKPSRDDVPSFVVESTEAFVSDLEPDQEVS
jgi:hypothetical protein